MSIVGPPVGDGSPPPGGRRLRAVDGGGGSPGGVQVRRRLRGDADALRQRGQLRCVGDGALRPRGEGLHHLLQPGGFEVCLVCFGGVVVLLTVPLTVSLLLLLYRSLGALIFRGALDNFARKRVGNGR